MLKHIVDWRIVLLSFALASCGEKETTAKTETFPVTKPIIIDTNSHVDYVAEIMAVKNIEIRSMIPGYLSKVHVDEGQEVSEGQILFSINNASYKEEVVKNGALLKISESEMQNANLEVQNTKELVQKNVISKIELEFAKNKLQIAKARVEEAKANLAHAKLMLTYTVIKAPFHGIINRLPQKIGSLIEEGSLLTTLSQNNEVFAYFDVSEAEYLNFMSKLTKGHEEDRKVQLVLANGKTFEKEGFIETMEGEIDENTGNISVRCRFQNPNFILKHGASGKLRMPKKFKNALIIPQKSTFEIQDKIFVYVLNKDKSLRMQLIEVSERIPHLYVVRKGLSTSDFIIYEGIQLAKEGMKIKTKFLPLQTIINQLNN